METNCLSFRVSIPQAVGVVATNVFVSGLTDMNVGKVSIPQAVGVVATIR